MLINWLTVKDIKSMVGRHNKKYPKDKIKIGKKQEMYNNLISFKEGGTCMSVSCTKKHGLYGGYKPIDVSNDKLKRGAWLSSLDINNVMEYYHKQYQDFNYIGTLPIDFQKVYPEIYNMKFKSGKYGAIFNTDPSWKFGEHWFAMYLDADAKILCVFDSNGDTPPSQINRFIHSINRHNDWTIFINKTQHQYTDGPCGLFALNFIIERLTRQTSCKALSSDKKLNDESMEKLRCKLFK